MTPVKHAVRVFFVGWVFHLIGLTRSSFFVLISVLQPLIFATIAFYMWQAGARPGTLLYVALGAGLMGMWSATLFGSGGAIQWQRWQGTLELVIAAPHPFVITMLAMTAGGAVTVTVADADLPSLVAVIVAVPADTPVTTPAAETLATEAVLLVQVIGRPVSTFPFPSFNAADKVVV